MPGSIRVVSKRKGGTAAAAGETVIDIDRSNPVLGNPHVLTDHRDDAQRAEVIEAYRRDFAADSAAGGPMSAAVAQIRHRVAGGERIALRCWCAPRPCHGDLLLAAVLGSPTPQAQTTLL